MSDSRPPPLLDVEHLQLLVPIDGRMRTLLHDVTLAVREGESFGLVGESGSGKSMTALTIARLLPTAAWASGALRFDGTDVLELRGRALTAYRRRVGVVFQDPRAHINPVRSVGDFMTEAMRVIDGVSKRDAVDRATRALGEVGISDGLRRMNQWPHELSGGLLQRVMIATVLLGSPTLLLADEPTTALDTTTQAEVMAILDDLRRDRGLAMLFITHDLDLAAAACDRIGVMYAGRIVEIRRSGMLHVEPRHPYTALLAASRPDVATVVDRLPTIPGHPMSAVDAPATCAFAPRCPAVAAACAAPLDPAPVGVEEMDLCLRSRELGGRVLDGIR